LAAEVASIALTFFAFRWVVRSWDNVWLMILPLPALILPGILRRDRWRDDLAIEPPRVPQEPRVAEMGGLSCDALDLHRPRPRPLPPAFEPMVEEPPGEDRNTGT
jgi:hypothetical protein